MSSSTTPRTPTQHGTLEKFHATFSEKKGLRAKMKRAVKVVTRATSRSTIAEAELVVFLFREFQYLLDNRILSKESLGSMLKLYWFKFLQVWQYMRGARGRQGTSLRRASRRARFKPRFELQLFALRQYTRKRSPLDTYLLLVFQAMH